MATGREGKEKNKEEKRCCLGMRLTSDSIERIMYLGLVAAAQICEMKEYIHEFSNMKPTVSSICVKMQRGSLKDLSGKMVKMKRMKR
jgi:hypothetical protein